MSKRKRIIITVAASLGGLLLLLVVAGVIVLQSSWFANFVREKVISVAEESTGGIVEIGSVQFDLSHLTLRIRHFVLHGTEPKTADPLLRADLLELRIKLFSGLYHAVDLRYLSIDRPEANVTVFPNGTTNIPQPRVKSKSSSNASGLQTVVDLAVGQFELKNGLIQYAQQKTAFNARGQNLQVELFYNTVNPSYKGNLKIDPLLLTSGTRPPLDVQVNLPVTIEKDAVHLANGQIKTGSSKILVNASLSHLAAPDISASLSASISLPEIQRSFDLQLDTSAQAAPKTLNANLDVRMQNQAIQVQTAHIDLGRTTFDASGPLRSVSGKGNTRFNASLALDQLSRLLKVTSPETTGALEVRGTARLDQHSNYFVDGSMNTRDVSIRSGAVHISNVSLYTPFHADPYSISLDKLRFDAFGGTLTAKLFIEKMRRLSLEGTLQNFALETLARTFAGNRVGYSGTLTGSINARGDLQAKGTSGYTATARLAIAPGRRGIPVSGVLHADYAGSSGTVALNRSYIAFPHSRLDLIGSLNQHIDINFVSHNLNDFLPAAALASPGKPLTELPIQLQNGIATLRAQVSGNLSNPRINSNLALDRFAVEGRLFNHLGLDLGASPSGAAIRNGVLTRNGLRTDFDASLGLRKWSPVSRSPLAANLTLRNGNVADLVSLTGASVPAAGDLRADIHINGTYGNPLGSLGLQVLNGSIYNEPFDHLTAKVDLSDRLITLSTLQLAHGAARINAAGTFAHPRDSFTSGHAEGHIRTSNLQLANIQTLQHQNAGVAGLIQLTADAAADLRQVHNQSSVAIQSVNADLSATGLRVQNQDAGQFTLAAHTANGSVNYQIASDFAGSNIGINGHTALTGAYATVADASINNLSIEKVLRITGQSSVPARGIFSANAHLKGTVDAPTADLRFALRNADLYQEPLNRLEGAVSYSNTALNISSLDLVAPSGRISLSGAFNHPANNFKAGTVALHVDSSDVQLARIEHVQQMRPGTTGILHLGADLSGRLLQVNGKPEVLFSTLNAELAANSLRTNNRNLGSLHLGAKTTGQNVDFSLSSDLAQSSIQGSGTMRLTGNYPVNARLSFANIHYDNLAPFISTDPSIRPSFDALVEGDASVNGPLLNTDNLAAQLRLTRLEAQTSRRNSPTGGPPGRAVGIHNNGPIIVRLNHSVVQLAQFHMQGPSTTIDAGGTVSFSDPKAPLHVDVNADADLGLIQEIDRDFYSSGKLTLATSIRGNFAQPLVNGRVELKNASINYADVPNGLSNGNGVILLNGTSATIQNLTGESGGGKIAVTGFAGLTGKAVTYNLRATADKVRVRYSGISITSDAAIALTGNTNRSLASGRVTIQRIAYASTSDAGSILSGASVPSSAPSTPSGIIAGMRLAIQIVTAPELRVASEYTQRLQLEANLTLRGTAANPGMVGRVSITDGQLVFFGNQYTVNQGTINFYSPNAIQPVLNFSLQTTAQGVNVTLGVTGPINNLKLSYRSDPPLTFEQIVRLLATNTTPNDPSIAARQPAPAQQTMAQMGESAVLGQAVANPLASRVQRVFGLSQFKVDPSFQGNGGIPTAKVTLQEQIASNVMFTYITDVSQPNSQIVRVEWSLTPRFSAVGLRDYNGVVSLEFFYNFKVR
ncbi:MAG TPA: translocation/assembly module TamB domain-containing protein [Bryobacteraceae bacterium]|nr:translocation/assembly module TamB domain-containing protein [Bryobacteraceae bacterium]